MEDQIFQMGQRLKKDLEVVQKSMNKNFQGITPEMQDKVKGPHQDLNKAIRAAKSGDIDQLHTIANKYKTAR